MLVLAGTLTALPPVPAPRLHRAQASAATAPLGTLAVLERAGGFRTDRLAQDAPAASTPPATTTPDAAATPAATPAADAPAADAADDEPDIELLRMRSRLTRTHRLLGITTLASLVVTEALGTILAINLPTLFGPGLCTSSSGRDLLGAFGCEQGGLQYLHETSGFISIGLYASTGIFALAMPDPEHAAAGHDARGTRLRLHRTMAWVHVVGMILEPILGIISAAPQVIGVQPGNGTFASDMRTIHLGVGYVTLAALTTAFILEY